MIFFLPQPTGATGKAQSKPGCVGRNSATVMQDAAGIKEDSALANFGLVDLNRLRLLFPRPPRASSCSLKSRQVYDRADSVYTRLVALPTKSSRAGFCPTLMNFSSFHQLETYILMAASGTFLAEQKEGKA